MRPKNSTVLNLLRAPISSKQKPSTACSHGREIGEFNPPDSPYRLRPPERERKSANRIDQDGRNFDGECCSGVLVRVPEERADVELQRDALVRADGAGGELHLHDGVGVLLALLDVTARAQKGGHGHGRGTTLHFHLHSARLAVCSHFRM